MSIKLNIKTEEVVVKEIVETHEVWMSEELYKYLCTKSDDRFRASNGYGIEGRCECRYNSSCSRLKFDKSIHETGVDFAKCPGYEYLKTDWEQVKQVLKEFKEDYENHLKRMEEERLEQERGEEERQRKMNEIDSQWESI